MSTRTHTRQLRLIDLPGTERHRLTPQTIARGRVGLADARAALGRARRQTAPRYRAARWPEATAAGRPHRGAA